jgi:putative FmdB family regulatory protein
MPIFEYRCKSCRFSFDALQKASDGALRKCPECGRLALQKVPSAPAFHLRGSGWHKQAASDKKRTVVRRGHVLDSGPAHSHEDHHSSSGHSHSHDGHTHTHGHGHRHDHKR